MQRNRRSGKLKDFARSLCFLSPSFLGVFLFFILPFAVVVKYAFTNAAGEPVQFQNIVNLLKNYCLLITQHFWTALNGFIYD